MRWSTILCRFGLLLSLGTPPLWAVAPDAPPQDAADENPRHRLQRLDDPNGEFVVDALGGDELLKLTGRIKCLRITSIDGSAVLDASGLNAAEIIVTGSISGGTRVRLTANRGRVDILGEISGGAQVDVVAPGGIVAIGRDDHISIGGGTRVSVLAQELILRGGADGGSHVDVSLSRAGLLRFARLDQGAQVTYHRVNPNDPEPRIERGEITGGAFCREADGERLVFAENNLRARNRPQDIQPVHREDTAREPGALRQRESRRDVPREPRPENPIDQPSGPMISTGVILVDGTRLSGQIVAVDGTKVTYLPTAAEAKNIDLSAVAVVIFRPIPESKRDAFDTDVVGLLLRSGDFLEGTELVVRDGRVSVSSAIFGLKNYSANEDVIALVLHRQVKGSNRGSEPAPLFPPPTEPNPVNPR